MDACRPTVRLWSLHPRYLDPKGLVALWREALLAQAVLAGETRGYTRHPQLERFRRTAEPLGAIGAYLKAVAEEAQSRGYAFAVTKIRIPGEMPPIPVSQGQLCFEWEHLKAKLARRDPQWLRRLPGVDYPEPHPLFLVVQGPKEPWEKG